MRNRPALKPILPADKKNSPRSQLLPSPTNKKTIQVPDIEIGPSVIDNQGMDNSDLLVINPIQFNKKSGRSSRGQPQIFRPKFESNNPLMSRNQKRWQDKNSARTPRAITITDIKNDPKCQKYESDIQEIENLMNKLVSKHSENEDYYRKHYLSFLRILSEASNSNPAKIPIVIQNTKMFFEGLLQNLIGKRGKLEKPNFDFEQKLRTIINRPNNKTKSSNTNTNDVNEEDDTNENNNEFENVFQDLFEESKNVENEDDEILNKKLSKYETEIEEIKNLMQKLINKHPENENYYRKHYEAFLRILGEAVNMNSKKAPVIIQNTKMFFEGLLQSHIGKNGRFKTKDFNFEEKLRNVLSQTNDDDENDNILKDIINDENENRSGNILKDIIKMITF